MVIVHLVAFGTAMSDSDAGMRWELWQPRLEIRKNSGPISVFLPFFLEQLLAFIMFANFVGRS
jgi:hypothetical protein